MRGLRRAPRGGGARAQRGPAAGPGPAAVLPDVPVGSISSRPLSEAGAALVWFYSVQGQGVLRFASTFLRFIAASPFLLCMACRAEVTAGSLRGRRPGPGRRAPLTRHAGGQAGAHGAPPEVPRGGETRLGGGRPAPRDPAGTEHSYDRVTDTVPYMNISSTILDTQGNTPLFLWGRNVRLWEKSVFFPRRSRRALLSMCVPRQPEASGFISSLLGDLVAAAPSGRQALGTGLGVQLCSPPVVRPDTFSGLRRGPHLLSSAGRISPDSSRVSVQTPESGVAKRESHARGHRRQAEKRSPDSGGGRPVRRALLHSDRPLSVAVRWPLPSAVMAAAGGPQVASCSRVFTCDLSVRSHGEPNRRHRSLTRSWLHRPRLCEARL